jgi:hypothetical protein
VRVDIVDLVRLDMGRLQGVSDRPGGAFTVGRRLGKVEGVTGIAVADELGQDGRAALQGVLQVVENQHSGAFTEDETVTLGIEGAAGRFRVVVSGG